MAEASLAAGHSAAEHATTTGLNHRKVLMWAFLGSECLFFGSLISTYVVYRDHSLVGPFPQDTFDIPYTSVSSFVLLMSSLTMVLALAAIQRANVKEMRVWLAATALLGTVFVGGQVYEFTDFVRHGLTLSTNLFGTTFFVLTGFHGAHVTIGVILLTSLFLNSLRGKIKKEDSLTVELAGLYWHFVDVVWVVIFTVVYLLPY
ncbi:MAG TPA: cytochrome c oxidase subunit 3 [Chloroflexota bacterium]|nr:cytochrome c oxidase subunit 3 [Chloroflexota bacterium]